MFLSPINLRCSFSVWRYFRSSVMITRWRHCLSAAIITRWHYYIDAVMITRWCYCFNAVMITRWQYCLSAAVSTRWHYYIDAVMITRWCYCLNAVMITRWQYCLSAARAVDNALNVIQSVVRLERGRHYRSRKCCSVRITCTVAANIFFKCKFENFLMVESTMCLRIKVAELNPLSDGKGITGISSAVF